MYIYLGVYIYIYIHVCLWTLMLNVLCSEKNWVFSVRFFHDLRDSEDSSRSWPGFGDLIRFGINGNGFLVPIEISWEYHIYI